MSNIPIKNKNLPFNDSDLVLRRALWIFAVILDAAWMYLSFQSSLMMITFLFFVRICLDVGAFVLTFKKNHSPSEFFTLIAVWIWVLAVAGLISGNASLFLICSMISVGLLFCF